MTTFVVTNNGNTVFTGTGSLTVKADGAVVYEHADAPPGSFPYESRTLPPPGSTGKASIQGNLVQGTTYAFALPLGKGGTISVSPEGSPPLMGTNASWEVAITQAPGDWATAKTMDATTNPKDGSINTPYYAAQGGESGGMGWTLNGALPAITKEQWYFNLRITSVTTPTSNAIYVQPALT